MKIRVISAQAQAQAQQQQSADKNDAFDKHNKPRTRRDIILSSIKHKYPKNVSFTSPASIDGANNLFYLYSTVHDVNMIQFLLEAYDKWKDMGPSWDRDNCHPEWKNRTNKDGVPPMVPCHSAFRTRGNNNSGGSSDIERPSTNVMGAMGYYCTDLITPIVESLVAELEEDANVICSAVHYALLNNDEGSNNEVVYALTTHPGHHASYNCFGGYCYLNNAALCARLIQRQMETGASIISDGKVVSNYWQDAVKQGQKEKNSRVAILDIDYHCGNGTASILYEDPSIFFTSIHCNPEIDYPWNTGYEDQTGAGQGVGTTLFIPLEPGATWEGHYKLALSKAMNAIMKFDPAALVISLGLDTYLNDAVAVNRGGFKLKGDDYYEMGLFMGKYLKNKNMPCVFVQEGGYKMDTIGDAAADVLGGFAIGACDGEKVE